MSRDSGLLIELLHSLWGEKVLIELDRQSYHGKIRDVAREGNNFVLVMKDVIAGEVTISCSEIREVRHRDQVAWHDVFRHSVQGSKR